MTVDDVVEWLEYFPHKAGCSNEHGSALCSASCGKRDMVEFLKGVAPGCEGECDEAVSAVDDLDELKRSIEKIADAIEDDEIAEKILEAIGR